MQPQPIPPWLEQFLLWLNHPVWHHWGVAGACFALVALLALLAPATDGPRRGWQHPALFAGAVLLALAAFRWPTWFIQHELNPDESQILSGAITLRHFPVYWRDVDTMTAGPLDVYVPAAASLFGLPLNFFGARVLAALVQAAVLLCTGLLLRRLAPERMARLALLPPLLFWCLVSHHDFIHYSSELISLLLLALAAWLIGRVLADAAPPAPGGRWSLFLGGFVLGLVPLAKLQGIPPALALGGIGLVVLAVRKATHGWKPFACLLGGGLAAPALATGLIFAAGQSGEVWQGYLGNNLAYVQAAPNSGGWSARLLELVGQVAVFRIYWWTLLVATLLLALPAWWRGGRVARGWLAAAWIVFGASIVAVLTPGRPLPHYLEFVVIPLVILLFAHWRACRDTVGWPSGLLFLAATSAPLLWVSWKNPNIYAGQFAHHRYEHPPSQAAYFIHQRAQPGDRLAMWGWYSQLYIDTGLPQGTRESQTTRQLDLDPAMRAFYFGRYLRDLRTNRPQWFVDAVGPASLGYHDRALHGHEAIPELADIIAADYEFLGDIENLRIYRRR